MKGSQEDFQTMAVVCDDYLADNAAVIAANPLMQELKTELHADILQVQTANQAKQKKSQGLTMDKEEKSDKAIDLIIELAGYGKVFARRTNNPDLLAQLKVNRTSLDILEDTELPDALRALHRNLAGIGVPGERYGISTPKLTAVMAAITDYEAAGPGPRHCGAQHAGHPKNSRPPAPHPRHAKGY